MTPASVPPQPSPLAIRCLRIVTSKTRADAIVGDVVEEAARRPIPSRLRVEASLWRHVLAEGLTLPPSGLRALGFVMRDAFRSLRRTPAVSALVLGILTLGISSATITFSVVDAVVIRPLPFPDPDQLIVVEQPSDLFSGTTSSVFVYEHLRDRVPALTHMAAVVRGAESLRTTGEPEPVSAALVTANLFDILGVRPILGATFDSSHEVAGNQNVALIGYGLWQRRFGADPAVIGQSLALATRSVTIVGVMPPGFAYPLADDVRPELWTPFVAPDDERSGVQLSSYLHLVSRLPQGTSLESAEAQARTVLSTLSVPAGGAVPNQRLQIRSLSDTLLEPVRGWMLLVLAGVVLVLLVACANVANLLLTRASRRARELSIRASIGASRRHLGAMMVAESVTLSLTAAALGLLVANWGVEAARAALPTGIARASAIAIDWRIIGAATAAALVTGLTFGLVPAWQAARHDLVSLLKHTAASTSLGPLRWRSTFLVAQVAFVGLLLVATTLFVSSFVRVITADLGFERRNLLTAQRAGLIVSVADVMAALEAIPGVTSVGAYSRGSAPLALAGGFPGGATGTRVWRPDAAADAQHPSVLMLQAAPGYFTAAGIALLAGRDLQFEELGRPDRVVLDAVTARRLFGEPHAAIGADVLYGGRVPATVIGVVETVLDGGPEAAPNPMAYFPTRPAASAQQWLVRTADDPATVVSRVETVLNQIATPGGRPATVRVIDDAFRVITAERRFAAGLMSICGILALVIGTAGVYGVMLSIVTQQTREFGIRVALGATAHTILSGVLAQAGRHLAVGLIIGLTAGLLASRTVASLFFGVQPTDAWIYLIVAAVTLLTGLVAAWLPARRAARIDPQVALRAE